MIIILLLLSYNKHWLLTDLVDCCDASCIVATFLLIHMKNNPSYVPRLKDFASALANGWMGSMERGASGSTYHAAERDAGQEEMRRTREEDDVEVRGRRSSCCF